MNLKKLFTNLTIITVIVIGLNSCKETPKEANVDAKQDSCLNPSGFIIKRGVNLSHWLSQDFGWSPKYKLITENDIRFIDSIGYDHVRIPIDEIEMWDSTGKPIDLAFSYLTQCLEWCQKYQLRAIVDLHTVRAHHFNAANQGETNALWTDSVAQQNFVNLWAQLSERLIKYPVDMVAYEILNEAVAPEHDDWNKLMLKALTTIRKNEPNRVIIIGANMWQIAQNLQYLSVPEGDKNIILSFHTYSPMAFTHYKADWTPFKAYLGAVHYPGQIITNEDYKKYVDTTNASILNVAKEGLTEYNKQKLYEVFAVGIEFAKLKNLQIYCGEFGCMPTVERKDRMAFYGDMISALEENNVAWCNWEYKGDFGIYFFDMEKKTSSNPDFEFINVLLKNVNK